jgi:hypothetical protein
MPYLVCAGATLHCSFGTDHAAFAASGGQVLAGGSPAGVVTDDVPVVNVLPFGLCTSPENPAVEAATARDDGVFTPAPCVPLLLGGWSPGSAQVTIGNVSALDDSSQCHCAWGGAITVTNPGQGSVSLQ